MKPFRPFSTDLFNNSGCSTPTKSLLAYSAQGCRQGAEPGVSSSHQNCEQNANNASLTRSAGCGFIPVTPLTNGHRPRTKSSSLEPPFFSSSSLLHQQSIVQKSFGGSAGSCASTLNLCATTMKSEVDAAVDFLTYLLSKARFGAQVSEAFRRSMTALLMQHYSGHWYPTEPLKGSGYRCLRVNGVMHPLLAIAAELSSIPLETFRKAFPAELTIWIDPGDVNVRFGEEGSIGVYFAKSASTSSLYSASSIATPASLSSSPVNHQRVHLLGSSASLLSASASTPLTATPLSGRPKHRRPIAPATTTTDATSRSVTVSPTRLFDAPIVTPASPRRSPIVGALSSAYRNDDHRQAPPSEQTATCGSAYQLCANVHLGLAAARLSQAATAPTALVAESC